MPKFEKNMIFLYKIGGPIVRQDGRMFEMGDKFEDNIDWVARFGADKFDRLPDRTKIPPENRLGAPAPVKKIEPLPPRSGDLDYEEDNQINSDLDFDPDVKSTLEAMDINQLKEYGLKDLSLNPEFINKFKTKKALLEALLVETNKSDIE